MSNLDKNLSNKSKILISGLTGFVGTNLHSYLKERFVIQGLSRTNSESFISYSDLNKSLLDQSKVFVHLAGKAHDLKNVSNDFEYFEVNTDLTKKLFNDFVESDCEVFIYMSSVKATADEVEGILDENHKSNHGVCKKPIAFGGGSLEYDVVPGNASNSILHARMNSDQPGDRMPEIGRSLIHEEGVLLIESWINSLPAESCSTP